MIEFFGKVGKFFLSPLGRYVLIGLTVLSGVLALRWHWIDVGAGKQRARDAKVIQRVQTDLMTCSQNTAALKATIDRQNAAVTAMQQVSDAKLAEADKVALEALKGRKRAEAQAAELLKPHPSSGDVCKDLMEAVQ